MICTWTWLVTGCGRGWRRPCARRCGAAGGAGTLLPATRVLAADLGVGRGAVAEAYAQLTGEGWLTSRQGSGTRVAATEAAVPVAAVRHGLTSPEARRLRYNLLAGYPDLSAFPRAGWLAAARKALAAAPSQALGYGDPRGRGELRVALAAYLARVRGVRASPDQIVVCTGSTQGLALVSRVLADRGVTTVGVEEYSHPVLVRAVTAAGLSRRTLTVDDSGAAVGCAGDAGAILLTPAHQFPLGPALSPERRAEAARWAARTGGLIIEDDYDGEFRYDRQPPARSRRWRPSMSSTWAPRARPWRRDCGWAGWCCPRR